MFHTIAQSQHIIWVCLCAQIDLLHIVILFKNQLQNMLCTPIFNFFIVTTHPCIVWLETFQFGLQSLYCSPEISKVLIPLTKSALKVGQLIYCLPPFICLTWKSSKITNGMTKISLFIPVKPLHNRDIVSKHFNNCRSYMGICNTLTRHVFMLTYIYLNLIYMTILNHKPFTLFWNRIFKWYNHDWGWYRSISTMTILNHIHPILSFIDID